MKTRCYSPLSTILLIAVIFISGCIGATPPTTPTGPSPAPQAGAPATEKESLTTVITPARDLTGEWEGSLGSAKWRDNVVNWACSYEGYIHLSLRQDGNALTGTFQATIAQVILNSWNTGKVPCSLKGVQPSAPLTGTVSSSGFTFIVANIIDFDGTFTTDLMQGTFESCPDQLCPDSTRSTGTIGDFKATRQR